MRNYLHQYKQFLYVVLLGVLFWATPQTVISTPSANAFRHTVNDPPVFEPAPDDVTVNCLSDVPAPLALQATDDTDPSFPKMINPMDTPDLDACGGGIIRRVWSATDEDNNTARVEQLITILPDSEGPVVELDPVNDVVTCGQDDFSSWINTTRLLLSTSSDQVYDACGNGISAIDYQPKFDDPAMGPCETRTVTFLLTDGCGNTTEWQASYTTQDNQAPVFDNMPADVTVSCEEAVPPIPEVGATDNCATDLSPLYDEETTPLGNCPGTNYTIVRTWTVSDDCGNESTIQQVVKVADETGPSFTAPSNITITCNQDPTDLNLTGDASGLQDNCDNDPRLSFTDAVIDESCPATYLIERSWVATDACGNTTIRKQMIEVRDDEAPSFVVPPNVTVSCEEVNDPSVTGRPTEVSDNCDDNPSVRIDEETVFRGDAECANEYEIRRVWRVEDACGNATEKTQTLFVIDESAPVISQVAADRRVACNPGVDPDAIFAEWIAMHGNALAEDNCTLAGDLSWSAFNSGSSEPATLPAISCPAAEGVLRQRRVDFVVTDECGNTATTSAGFIVTDDIAPVILNCSEALTIPTDPGTCAGTYTFGIPQIEENCSSGSLALLLTAMAGISSQASPGQEGDTPVDPAELVFLTQSVLPLNVSGEATLLIRLVNVDGEEANEYFHILGEDGTLLGQTNLTGQQCGNSETILSLTREQVEAWAADGELRIRLEPNIPEGQAGRFAVNAICDPAGRIEGQLDFERKELPGLLFEYSINDGDRLAMTPAAAETVELPQGANKLTLFVTDCAGNTNECSYFVRVVDQEAPLLTCPDDIAVNTFSGSCRASVTLPLPQDVTDNCQAGGRFEQRLPATVEEAFLTFSYDPNLNDYLAQGKSFRFTNAAANAIGPATLILDFQGDFSSNGAFLEVIGEDGSTLGQTSVGDADCNTGGQLTLSIPRETINTWARDGEVNIEVRVNDIPVPPGVPGDGVNPCDPNTVTADGDTDGVSYLYAALSYDNLLPSYYSEGATNLPLTQMRPPAVSPVHSFSSGVSTVYYLLPDASGNMDTCSFTVTVQDNEAPVARCQPTTVFINPSGLEPPVVDAAEIDAGSSDNCAIDTMFLSPNTFSCEQVGSTVQVALTVLDEAGNGASCITPIRLESLRPEPDATSGVCGNDTLYLSANPPAAEGGVVFTYRWTGPAGFVSDKENPIIPNVDQDNAGSYLVEITGITGCKATGTVEVAIEDLPLTPELLTVQDICVDEDIELFSSLVPAGSGTIYRWYRGVPPDGILVATTSLPAFTVPAPHEEGIRSYYLTIESDGCISAPSIPVNVRVTNTPQAVVNDAEIIVCEGESIALGTPVSGPGIQYVWTGPDGFSSSSQFPAVIEEATASNAGVYTLIVNKNGCLSDEAVSVVNVLPRPQRPQLSNTGPVCEGSELVLTTNVPRASVYRWVSPDLQEFVTTNNQLVIPEATQDVTGPWQVSVAQFGCNSESSAPSEVVVNANPPTQASASQNIICEGDQLQLFAAPTLSNAVYRWTGPGGFSASTQNPVINNLSKSREGTYQVTITTAEGCSGTASVTVVVQRSPVITAVSNDAPDCLSGPTDIRLAASLFPADPGTYRYEWTGPNGYSSRDSVAVIRNATEAGNGNYRLVITTAEGCTSESATITVQVSNPPTAPAVPRISEDNPAPFCEGETVQLLTESYAGVNILYNWRTPKGVISTTAPALDIPAATPDDSGAYSVFVTVDGCDSQESGMLNVSIGQTPQITATTNSPVCEGGVIQLRTEILPDATYSWMGPGFTSDQPNPEITQAKPGQHDGTYSLRVNLNGCTSGLATTQVRVKPSPARPALDNSGPLCVSEEGAELTLTVSPDSRTSGATYSWFGPQGSIAVDTPVTTLRLTDLAAFGNGSVEFTASASVDGCSSALSNPSVVQLNTIPGNRAFAGDDFRACEGFATNLEATAPSLGGGVWTLVGGAPEGVSIANPDQAETAVSGLQGGQSYTFRWTLSNGACRNYSSDDVRVNVTESEVVFAGKDTVLCSSDEVMLEAAPVATSEAYWAQTDVQGLLGVEIVEPANPNTMVVGMEPGNLYVFTWTVVGGCGEIKDDVFVLISDPNPFAGLDKVACNDDGLVQLEADEPTEGSRGKWSSANPQVSFTDPRNPLALAMGLTPGENVLLWTIDDGTCGESSRDTVVITYKRNPVANPDAVQVPFGETVTFDLTANDSVPPGSFINILQPPSKGTVEQNDDGSFTYRSNANLVGEERMVYELCSDACACSETTVTFTVGEDARCDVPNIFTPNDDGINDTFVVPCLLKEDTYPNSQVIIFNRWGDEVYKSPSPYKNDWRGTFNGEELPVGTYFYVIDLGDGSKPVSGYTVIQR